MKKIIFLAVAVAGFSVVGMAQEASPALKRAPVQDQKAVDKANNAKSSKATKSPVVSVTPATPADRRHTEMAKGIKAGLTDQQAAALAPSVADVDRRSAEVEANSNLSTADKRKAQQELKAEKAALLKKSKAMQKAEEITVDPLPASKTAITPAANAPQ